MRVSHVVIVAMMLIPALVSMGLMISYAGQYHDIIERMDKVSTLSPLVKDALINELFSVVAGRKKFEEGTQFETLAAVNGQLDALLSRNPASKDELTVARRTMNTLTDHVYRLGDQMREGSTVEENEALLEDVRDVSALVVEMLQDSITAEIDAATSTSNQLQVALRATLLIEAGLLALTLLFAMLAQRSLNRAIQQPIEQLVSFAGRIAGGHLDERAPPPGVDELQGLTQSLNAMAGKLAGLIEENRREQENLKKSELRALQAQITPHFLYNTLDAIVWLAEAKKTGEVVAITRAMSSFFRISLSNGQDWITIAQEVEHLQGYLTIQKIRYRDILDYEIDVDEALYAHKILKLTIQPLVENAIYHGIKNRRGGGHLRVKAWREGEKLLVSVADDGAGMSPERLSEVRGGLISGPPAGESGYGLYSVDKRLKLYYNQPLGLKVESKQGEGTVISFRVPLM